MRYLTGSVHATSADEVQSGAISANVPTGISEVDLDDRLRRLLQIADDAAFEDEWRLLDTAFPGNQQVWKTRVQRLIRDKAYDEAIRLIDDHDFEVDADGLHLLAKAELLHDARECERAGEIFRWLVERYPDRRDIRMNYAKRLFAEGYIVSAYTLIMPVEDTFPEGSKSFALVEKVANLLSILTSLEGRSLGENEDARIIAMKHAILWFRDREVRKPAGKGLGRLSLITGSLGPGGAERQLTRLAIEVERARRSVGELGGTILDRPVEVVVRSHGPEKQNDFYLAELQAAGVELSQINLFKPLATRDLGIEDEVLAALIDYLPPPVNYGVRRLAAHLRESGTDTASIWQDGACLFAGLAALVAGVPHVQLAIRGLPPSMRRHMYRPEYEVLYKAMAEVPGVSFVSNSLSAARAYAEWLDVPTDRFSIVYNGVEPMRAIPSAECEELWRQFAESTPGATHTVGGVFRFDTDKQPLLWIRFAARHLKRHPSARFVLVGGGRLLPNARQLAEELKISDRILFVGRSTRVGYWMSKMNVLVLLSRYEGLPNVLLEAQYMGVRVVTTPAGGAAECLIDGTTGYVLECAEKPDLDRVADRVYSLVLRSGDRELFAEDGPGRAFLDSHFSIPRMLEDYVRCTAACLHALEDEEGHAPRRRVA